MATQKKSTQSKKEYALSDLKRDEVTLYKEIILFTNNNGGQTIARINYTHIPKEEAEGYADYIIKAVEFYNKNKNK